MKCVLLSHNQSQQTQNLLLFPICQIQKIRCTHSLISSLIHMLQSSDSSSALADSSLSLLLRLLHLLLPLLFPIHLQMCSLFQKACPLSLTFLLICSHQSILHQTRLPTRPAQNPHQEQQYQLIFQLSLLQKCLQHRSLSVNSSLLVSFL